MSPELSDAVHPGATASARRALGPLARWESALVLLLLITLLYGSQTSPAFMHSVNFFYITINVGEVAIMALPLMLIVITGEIDLSVAAILGLSGAVMADLFAHGTSIWVAMGVALLVGGVAGLFNGLLITRVGLPSLAVTIGTLALYRGIAQILLPDNTVGGFPTHLTDIGINPIPHTQISYSMGFFIVLAVVIGIVLHATPIGRSIFAIGANQEAAFFSGIRVKRIKLCLFVLSGFLCAFAGILWTLRFASARYDAGAGLELDVVTIVLLGGVSIFGGRGTIIGVILAVAVLGCLQDAFTLANIPPEEQNIVVGGLLLASVIVPNIRGVVSRVLGARRARRNRPRAGGADPPGDARVEQPGSVR